jgi:class I fructose-bisphosphate aldolase
MTTITTSPKAATRLDDLSLSTGKRARLRRLLYGAGPGNGTLLILPLDQGLEHGPRDFFPNPPSADPTYQLRLASEGGFSGIALQVGVAEKYLAPFAGQVPLVLKLNGKTEIPTEPAPLSPLLASVEDAVRLGGDAIGYTLYVGSPRQADDFVQFRVVRQEAERYGMPVIVWAYPRGEAVETRGGRDSLYAIDYAARVALEVGADIVKVNFPKLNPATDKQAPKPYSELDITEEEAITRIVASAGKALVLFSGGEHVADTELLRKAELAMDAGATGLIFGRNIWQRPFADAMAISRRLSDLLDRHGR